eukprot:1187220-Prymnesium_polylepis.2
MSAPPSQRVRTASTWPYCAAKMSGVLRYMSPLSIVALPSMSTRMHSTWPRRAARINGVSRPSSVASGSAPRSRSNATASFCPL